ncbi:MAG: SDR family oxidoreductase [candidate division WOR-3 bacterium]|nr:SDR family oxidoreductase [candidate division WOR-3 bacterium]MDW8150938.1 SDR family oxidoreductase [candidate division WOR-3 bacterium]
MNIIITGASSGIGKATYELLKKEHNVIGISRNGPDIKLDLSITENIKNLANLVNTQLDILINNVGIAYVKSLEKSEISEIEEQISINLKSAILVTKVLLEKINQNGLIINIGSIASKFGFDNWSVYSATKFGIGGFSHSLRKELSKKGIRVCLVMPGAVWTPIWEKNGFKKTQDMLTPEDIAMVIKHIINMPNYVNIDEIVITHVKRAY